MTGAPSLLHVALLASTPIDDFLAGADGTTGGERWETVGFGLALAGVVVSVGIVAFLARVHIGSRAEVRTLVVVARGCGASMLIGGVVEVAGTAAVLDIGWIDAFTDASASSAMMRVLAGLLVLMGLGDDAAPVRASAPDAPANALSEPTDVDHRWVPGAASAFGVVGLGLGVLAFAFDGHTTSEGPRALHAAVTVVHVLAAGVWAGGIIALAILGVLRRREVVAGIGGLVVRFSSVATVALVAVIAAGAAMAWMILGDVGDIVDTDWGRRLLIKTAAVGVAALLGAYNRFVLVPRLEGDSTSMERTIRTTITLEALVLAIVIVVTVLLTRAANV